MKLNPRLNRKLWLLLMPPVGFCLLVILPGLIYMFRVPYLSAIPYDYAFLTVAMGIFLWFWLLIEPWVEKKTAGHNAKLRFYYLEAAFFALPVIWLLLVHYFPLQNYYLGLLFFALLLGLGYWLIPKKPKAGVVGQNAADDDPGTSPADDPKTENKGQTKGNPRLNRKLWLWLLPLVGVDLVVAALLLVGIFNIDNLEKIPYIPIFFVLSVYMGIFLWLWLLIEPWVEKKTAGHNARLRFYYLEAAFFALSVILFLAQYLPRSGGYLVLLFSVLLLGLGYCALNAWAKRR